jgi:hypothetical protein
MSGPIAVCRCLGKNENAPGAAINKGALRRRIAHGLDLRGQRVSARSKRVARKQPLVRPVRWKAKQKGSGLQKDADPI